MSPNFSSAKNLWVAGGIGVSLILVLFVTGCGGERLTSTAQASAGTVEQNLAATTSTAAASEANADSTYLLFNQKLVEGLTTESVDLNDVDEVFWHIFSRLPDQVTVYPSENYYYFIMYTDRRQLWGNIRLAAGRRDRGVLSFAYFEFRETPYVTEPRVSSSKFFTDADGLRIEELDPFTYKVSYNQKEVVFNLLATSKSGTLLLRRDQGEMAVL